MKLDYLNQLIDGDDFEDIFKDFNFKLLDDLEFKEDAVREEIIFPILKLLGYSASGENKIIRSKALKHPFYYFGTTKYNVNIIPDYTFEIKNKNRWILDAKRPTENIEEGKNVFQAYSYAMHPEIQSEIYCLCNGKKLTVFNVNIHKSILTFDLKNLKENWNSLKDLLSPELVLNPHIKEYELDFGLFLFKIGDIESKIKPIKFPLKQIFYLGKISEDMYSINSVFSMKGFENQTFLGTFDFNKKQYDELLKLLPEMLKNEIEKKLNNQPFYYFEEESKPTLNLSINAMIGREILTNDAESYLPFEVINFEK